MARLPITEERFLRFCELVENGTPRYLAAQEIGTTSTRVRWAVKRSPHWKRRYDQAMTTRRRAAELRRLVGLE